LAPTVSGLMALCRLAGFPETQLVGRKRGMGCWAPLRNMFPPYWTGGAVGTNPNVVHRSLTRLVPSWSFWPRAIVCPRPYGSSDSSEFIRGFWGFLGPVDATVATDQGSQTIVQRDSRSPVHEFPRTSVVAHEIVGRPWNRRLLENR